jgi:N-acetylmuramoyl-L-alanine amidase
MRLNWGLTSLLIVLAQASSASQATELRDLKVLALDGSTRAVLEFSGPAKYRMFTLENPRRLVLDLDATQTTGQFHLPGANGAVAAVRTGSPSPNVLRVVFDLGAAITPQAHMAAQGGGSRLTLEMTGNSQGQAVAPTFASVSAPGVKKTSVAVTLPRKGSAVNSRPANQSVAFKMPDPISASVPGANPEPAIESAGRDVANQALDSSASAPSRSPARIPDTGEESSQARFADATVVVPSPSSHVPAKTLQDVIGSGQRKLVVAVDAGHGGKDPGAHGPGGVHEKDVTLAVARELAKQINADPGMKAVLIRDGDSFVPLQQRYMKARAAQADLFISIHADASPNQTATGASVFVLSTRGASSQAARWLADSENAADLVGGVSLDDKDRSLSAVLLDLSQSATMRASDDVAEQVLTALKNVGKAHKREIERANFVVLRSPDVPSMLVETGFITNPGEEQKLDDPNYRYRLASAITSGVRQYFTVQAPPGSLYASRQYSTPLSQEYVVGRGESLSLIAARHGVAVESLREANNKQDDAVRVGEHLRIPAPTLALSPN